MRIGVLKDVACVPNVETGANVPSYSGGLNYFQNQSETLWLLSRTALG